MQFRFHDTLTGALRDFEPVEAGRVRMYNCGPTVYSTPQIGNFRAWTAWDLLRRSLELGGYEVTQVMNITDVGHLTLDDIESGEDKLEAASRRTGRTAWEIAEHYTQEFFEGVRALGFREAHHFPRATDHVSEMIDITLGLIERGHAYATPAGNVYFSIETFPSYGRLSGNSVEALVAGARVAVVDEKRHPADFALWKRDPNHQMQWDSPWGRGFPGWHIECTAMSRKYLGDEIDIHTGGEDNVFPHHECEIAQADGFLGRPFVRYWLHNRHLLVDGRKMSKSSGTMYTQQDVAERGYSMRALRYMLGATHYRDPINFTWQGLADAETTVGRLDATLRGVVVDGAAPRDSAVDDAAQRASADFRAALADDLNTSAALAAVHGFRRFVNAHGPFSEKDGTTVRATFGELDSVLGLGLLDGGGTPEPDAADTAEVERLLAAREAARAARDFAESDRLRDALAEMGVTVEDTPQGQRWHR